MCSMDPLQLHAITDRMTKPQTVGKLYGLPLKSLCYMVLMHRPRMHSCPALPLYRSGGNLTGQNKILDSDSFSRLKILLAMDISIRHIVFNVNVVVSNPSRDIGHILDFVTRLKKLRVSLIITNIVTKCVYFNLSKSTLLLYDVHVGLYTFEF